MAYVERNPVRAGLIAEPWDYPWSGAAAHCGLNHDDPLVGSWAEWEEVYGFRRWRQVLLSSVAEEALAQRIREAARCGWPLGSEAFVKELEHAAGRRLHPLPPGRPRADNERQAAAPDGQLTLEMGICVYSSHRIRHRIYRIARFELCGRRGGQEWRMMNLYWQG
jgi:hypothetical protein